MKDRFRLTGLLFAAALLGGVVAGAMLFSSPGIPGFDGYYHISVAALIWEHGLTFDFPWLPLTLLDSEHYVDMHMLFHVLQAPFAGLLPPEVAAKASATAFVAMATALFAWLLHRYEVPWPLFWVLLLLVLSDSFLYRMMMSRPPVFALIYSWLVFHCLMQRNHVGLGLVAVLFTWTYKVFPILLPLTIIGMFVVWVERREVDWRPLVAVCIGIIIGLAVNPYFPDNVEFLWNAIRMKVLSTEFKAHVGNEWYPLDTLVLFKDAAITLAAWLLALLLTDRDEWRRDPGRLFWFLVSTMWLVLLFKSRRFIEFFPPAALLFLVFAAKSRLREVDLRALIRRFWPASALLVVLLGVGAVHTLTSEYERMQGRPSVGEYAGASSWLVANTPAGSRVFHTDWDDFPALFFHNRHNIYLLGLDPDYMRLKDPGAYDLWRLIARGEIAHPENQILGRFDCGYVFTDNWHKSFIRVAEASNRMQRVYADDYARVYRVLPASQAAR